MVISKNILLFLLVGLMMVASANAADYYVDKDHPQASDSNPGTENLPWKSIRKGVNTAVAGDTVIFKKATTDYMVSSHLSFPNSGTSDNRIVFRAENPNEKPIWNWGGWNFRITDQHYITIDGFVIKNMADGFHTKYGSSNLRILNNHIIGQGDGSDGELLVIYGVDNLISHNEIEGAGHNAVYLTSWSDGPWTASGTIIEYNYIHDNDYHHGINIFPGTTDDNPLFIDDVIIRYNRIETSDWGIFTRYMRGFKIYNNIIYNNGAGIHLGGFDSDNQGAPNRLDPYDGLGAIVANNIIIAEPSGSSHGFDNARVNNMVFVNNIISSGFTDAVTYYNKNRGAHPVDGHTIDYNIIDSGLVFWDGSNMGSPTNWFSSVSEHNSHSLDTDSKYDESGVDARWNMAKTFSLQGDSPAINTGDDLSFYGIFDDYIQVSRPQGNGWDIGAYEFGGSVSFHPADLNQNGCVDISEIVSYVDLWKDGLVTIQQVVSGVEAWQQGCP